jgi:hypothetical protein
MGWISKWKSVYYRILPSSGILHSVVCFRTVGCPEKSVSEPTYAA